MKVTLTNSFHGTSAAVRLATITEGRFAGMHKISRTTALRLRTKLCGSSDCTCGGTFGECGGAYLAVVNEDYERNYIIDMRSSNF